MTKTNAERQKKWRENHKDQNRQYQRKHRSEMREKYRSCNNYMDDWEDYLYWLEYRKFRTQPENIRQYPFVNPDTVWAGVNGWFVISVNDKPGQDWLRERMKQDRAT